MMPRPLGIDLGTTNSAVATLDAAGRTVMVPNSQGQLITPSVVFFADEEVVVGRTAKELALMDHSRAAICAKRDMGKRKFSQLIRGSALPPEVIQSCILKRLKNDAVLIHGQDLAAVITVPAYFDEPRRRATTRAGEMAGINVLDIVNEPTAAALAYGEELGYLDRQTGGSRDTLRVLVYDLGGGTFDVTLLEMQPGDIRTLATDGDVQLGGRDWDEALANYAADKFQESFQIDPRTDAQMRGNLILQAELVKQSLSQHNQTLFEVQFAERIMPVMITRQLFEELTENLLERTAYTARQLIQTAQLTWPQIDKVLLVGGSTRMPMVRRMLTELTGKPPEQGVHPDEAVARGAALYADYLLHKKSPTGQAKFAVSNVNAHSLGIEGIDRRTQRKENVILIPRNTRLPAVKVDKFVTYRENQRSIVVNVLEGESRNPAHCSQIGRAVVRDLPELLPARWPVEVTYEYQENGCLKVSAKVPGTQQSVSIELQSATATSSQNVNRWRAAIESDKGLNEFERMLEDVLGEDDPSDDDDLPLPGDSNPRLAEKKMAPPPANPGPEQPKPRSLQTSQASGGQTLQAKPASPRAELTSTAPKSFSREQSPAPTPATSTVQQPAPRPPAQQTSRPPGTVPRRLADPPAESSRVAAPLAEEKNVKRQRSQLTSTLLVVGGFAVSAILGLLIGYYVVANYTPSGNFLNLPLPGLPQKAE
ncbi:MAG: Hsp70 family protein [Pirellulales bacterium]|nr:Hsp70 family protein [Pirellulales bacterium]